MIWNCTMYTGNTHKKKRHSSADFIKAQKFAAEFVFSFFLLHVLTFLASECEHFYSVFWFSHWRINLSFGVWNLFFLIFLIFNVIIMLIIGSTVMQCNLLGNVHVHVHIKRKFHQFQQPLNPCRWIKLRIFAWVWKWLIKFNLREWASVCLCFLLFCCCL